MPHSQEHQRELIVRIFEELGRGTGTSLRDASTADISWWLPLGTTEHRGVTDVERALVTTLAGRQAQLQCVVLGADARSAVVEQLLGCADGGTTPATSVLTLRDGAVVEGRTYLDVAAWGGLDVAAQHA